MEGTIPTPIFEEACKTAAKTFGKKHNVSVIFAGERAKTDGSTIYLPAMDQNKMLSQEQLSVARGYVDHEAGHIRHTDSKLYSDAVKEAMRCGDKLMPQIMNALEDVRIERLITKQYPGSKTNLQQTSKSVNKIYLDMHKDKPEVADTLTSVGPVGITWEGRRRLGYSNAFNEECLDTLPDDVKSQVEQFVDMVDGMESTADMITCAKTIANIIKTNEPPTEPDGDDEDDDGGDDEDDNKTTRTRGDENTSDHELDKDADLEMENYEPDDDNDKQGGVGASDTHKGKTLRKNKSVETIPVETNIGKLLGQKVHDDNISDTHQPYTVATTESDKYHHASDSKNKYVSEDGDNYSYGVNMNNPKGDKEYQKVIKLMGGNASVMRRKLERALLSTQMRGWDTGYEHGRFDTKRLVSAYQGDPNVFKLREEVEELDTAVSILVDMSGSMHGDPTLLAQQSCIALAESVNKVGCPLEIRGFTNRSGFLSYAHHPHRLGGRYSRTSPMDIFIFKSFDEKLMKAKRSLGNLASVQNTYGGNNSDACAVMSSIKSILKRKEKKRILMVLSDGYPAHSTSYSYSHIHQNLADVVKFGTDKGIDLIGIGIQSDAVKQFYPDYHVIHNLEDLTKKCMDKIAKRLLGQRYVVDNADLIVAKKIRA